MTREWNYVATAHKAAGVTHSCVGNFTGPGHSNLIVAKCKHIEIRSLTPNGLQLIWDGSIYGRITALELFRPHDEAQDFLFISTQRGQFSVLQWNRETSEPDTITMGDISRDIGAPPPDNGQIVIIDPDCRLIGLHLYAGFFKVIPIANKGLLQEEFNIRLDEKEVRSVRDIKFLYGYLNPTIAVLYQGKNNVCHVKTYEVNLEKNTFLPGPWSKHILISGGDLLMPVPPPHCGVIIVAEKTIVYCNATDLQSIPIRSSITRAYGRIDPDGLRYLLADDAGLVQQLVITHEKEKVTGLKFELLGKTSIASTISYLENGYVFVGSRFGDSQLIKLNSQADAKGLRLEVLERYDNLGPISDFCVVDNYQKGAQIVTCSGAFKDGSLRVIHNRMEYKEKGAVVYKGIKDMWSLRSSTIDIYDKFLILGFLTETKCLAMNSNDVLEEMEIEGFDLKCRTLFCSDAAFNQLIQITSSSVRLVDSKSLVLRNEWKPPSECTIDVATANATQVLLGISSRSLVYFDICNGFLTEVARKELGHEISCLDITPIGETSNTSQVAAVGLWNKSVRVFSLPDLDLKRGLQLKGGHISHSVLLCSFEGISHLLIAVGDGHLLDVILNASDGTLSDQKKVPLDIKSLTRISSKNSARVFAASDQPVVIYSKNQKLLYNNVNLKDATCVCSFSSAALPDSLALVKGDVLSIGEIDHTPKLHTRSIPLGEHALCICHQEQTRTFAVCCANYNQAGWYKTYFVRLLDDQTFDFRSFYPLECFESGCSILSCSFLNDDKVYYCVGTAYVLPEEFEPTKGRILVFFVNDGKLELISETKTDGCVYALSAFNGKLLAAINQKTKLYNWVVGDGCSRELQIECEHRGEVLALDVQTRGDYLIVGDLMKSINVLKYNHAGAIEKVAHRHIVDSTSESSFISAVQILDDNLYIGAEQGCSLFTARLNTDGEDPGRLQVTGEYHFGELVNRFRHGSLAMRLGSKQCDIPTVLFGTVDGAIGVVASLPSEQYAFLEKLQDSMRKVVKSVGGLSHEQWRLVYDDKRKKMKTVDGKTLLDGDLLSSFLHLDTDRMGRISEAMGIPTEHLCRRVQEVVTGLWF